MGERLLRGEDVIITGHSEPEMMTSDSGRSITDLADGKTGPSEGFTTNGTHHTDEPAPQQQHSHDGDQEIPADLVIQVLANRAGARETELAVRDARILMLEAEIRDLYQIIAQIQGK